MPLTDPSRRPAESEPPASQARPLATEGHGLRHILVCLDRSALSEICLPNALSLSKTFGSALTLLHVMEVPREPAGPHSTDAVSWEMARQEARFYLERLEKSVSEATGQPVEVRLEQGHPAERITSIAREIGADLIVMGRQGEGGVMAWNLGSTAQQVLAIAGGSVLVARSAAAPPEGLSPRRILVPLDGSLRTEIALPIVARIASEHGAEVVLVHVVQEPLANAILSARALTLAREVASQLEIGAKVFLESLREQLARDGIAARTLVVRHVDPRQCLLEVTQAEPVDLIVLSAHGSTCNAARPFGTVAAYLLSHSKVPLLMLQDLPASERPLLRAEAPEPAPTVRASYPPESP